MSRLSLSTHPKLLAHRGILSSRHCLRPSVLICSFCLDCARQRLPFISYHYWYLYLNLDSVTMVKGRHGNRLLRIKLSSFSTGPTRICLFYLCHRLIIILYLFFFFFKFLSDRPLFENGELCNRAFPYQPERSCGSATAGDNVPPRPHAPSLHS
jgi:hypothetical protein